MFPYFINILLFVPCYVVFGSKIPLDDVLTDLTREVNHTDEPPQVPFEISVPQYIHPGYYYTAIDPSLRTPVTTKQETFLEPRANTETTEIEPRTLPLLINLILIPKLIIKVVKAIAFGVSAATTLGAIVFLLSATLCTFTPVCFIGLAIPGLREVERSGRGFVQQIYDHIPGEKIEAAADILSNVLDKYAKIRISQSKKGDVIHEEEEL